MHYNVSLRRVRVTIVAAEKQNVVHILRVCVSVALVIQHVMRMRHICHPWADFNHIFPHYDITCTICGGKKLLNIK
jgi:uncharacterized membrane protein SirB2